MTQSLPYNDGDWFQNEDGLYYEFQCDIDSNAMVWYEVLMSLAPSQRVEPLTEELRETSYLGTFDGWEAVKKKTYGIDGIDNLKANSKNV